MTRKKLLVLLGSVCLAVMLAVPVVAGCAAPTPAPAPSPSPSPTPSPTPSPAPSPSPSAPAEVIHWKIQSSTFPLDPIGPYELPFLSSMASFCWANWLREATDGRLDIEVIGPEVAYPGTEGLTAIGSGVIEAGVTSSGWWTEQWPEWYVYIGLPGSWSISDEIYDAYFTYGLYDRIIEQAKERNLLAFPLPMMCYWNFQSSFPMPGPASIEGKKIRAYALWARYVELFGGKPVAMAYGDLYMGMKLGTIDGLITSAQGLEAMNLKEVISHYVSNTGPLVEVNLVNLDAYNALPEDIKAIVDQSPYYLATAMATAAESEGYVMAKAAEEYGITLWRWSDEDMAEVRKGCVEEIWPTIAEKSPALAELVELVKKQLEDHGKL